MPATMQRRKTIAHSQNGDYKFEAVRLPYKDDPIGLLNPAAFILDFWEYFNKKYSTFRSAYSGVFSSQKTGWPGLGWKSLRKYDREYTDLNGLPRHGTFFRREQCAKAVDIRPLTGKVNYQRAHIRAGFSSGVLRKLIESEKLEFETKRNPHTGCRLEVICEDKLLDVAEEWRLYRECDRFYCFVCSECDASVCGPRPMPRGSADSSDVARCDDCEIDVVPTVCWLTPKAAKIAKTPNVTFQKWIRGGICPPLGREIWWQPYRGFLGTGQLRYLCRESDLLAIKSARRNKRDGAKRKADDRRRKSTLRKDSGRESNSPDDWGIVRRYQNGDYRASLKRLAHDIGRTNPTTDDLYRLLYKSARYGTPYGTEDRLPCKRLSASDSLGRPQVNTYTARHSDVVRLLADRQEELSATNLNGWPDARELADRFADRLAGSTYSCRLVYLRKRLKDFRSEKAEKTDWHDEDHTKAHYRYNPAAVIPWLFGEDVADRLLESFVSTLTETATAMGSANRKNPGGRPDKWAALRAFMKSSANSGLVKVGPRKIQLSDASNDDIANSYNQKYASRIHDEARDGNLKKVDLEAGKLPKADGDRVRMVKADANRRSALENRAGKPPVGALENP